MTLILQFTRRLIDTNHRIDCLRFPCCRSTDNWGDTSDRSAYISLRTCAKDCTPLVSCKTWPSSAKHETCHWSWILQEKKSYYSFAAVARRLLKTSLEILPMSWKTNRKVLTSQYLKFTKNVSFQKRYLTIFIYFFKSKRCLFWSQC